MTDSDIVKALEICSKYTDVRNCEKCPLKPNCDVNVLETLALDLINRQQAEIEMDDVEIKELRIALHGYLDDLTKERNLYKKSIEELNQAKAEIERLKTNLNIELENYATEYDNKIKAEAYREFAERLKKELFIKQNEHRDHWMEPLNRHRGTEVYKDYEWSVDNWLRGYGEAVQDILAINQNFLKKLEGEDDG